MKRTWILTFAVVIVFRAVILFAEPPENVDFAAIEKRFGIKIELNVNSMIPPEWRGAPVLGRATPLRRDMYGKAAVCIWKSLERYPEGFIYRYLTSVALCDTLSFYSVAYGATAGYSTRSLIITVRPWYADEWVTGTFDHELSHLLVYYNGFPRDEWRETNKPGFAYSRGGLDAIRSGRAGVSRTENAFSAGFACEYGMSELEEDIATMVEYTMGDRKDFHARAWKYAIVKKKFKILKKYYAGLDPGFDENFWMRGFTVPRDGPAEGGGHDPSDAPADIPPER